MSDNIELSEFIKSIRRSRLLTQQAFAEKIGVTQNTVACWEIYRRRPGFKSMLKICKSFDIKIEDFARFVK